MKNWLTYSFLIFLLISCNESRVKRQLPGEWTLVTHTFLDEFGFTTECPNSSASLQLGNCKKGDCSYSFSYNYPCETSLNMSESGNYAIVEKGGKFLFLRLNIDESIDTIENNLFLLTSTDLKFDYYVPSTKRRHRLIFSR